MMEDSQLSDEDEDGGIPASQLEPETPEHGVDDKAAEVQVERKGFEELPDDPKGPMTLADMQLYLKELKAKQDQVKAEREARFPAPNEVIEIPETLPYGDDYGDTLHVPEQSFEVVQNYVDVKEAALRDGLPEMDPPKVPVLHRSAGLNRGESSGSMDSEHGDGDGAKADSGVVPGDLYGGDARKNLLQNLNGAEGDLFLPDDPPCWAACLIYLARFHMVSSFDVFKSLSLSMKS